MICYKCGKTINREKNIYGTRCPWCGEHIKSLSKISLNEKEMKMELLRNEMIEKLRKKIKGEK